MITIRKANIEDLPTIQQFGYQLLELERQGWDSSLDPKWPFSSEGEKAYRRAIENKFTIIAELDGEPVGYLVGSVKQPIPGDARGLVIGRLANIYVAEAFRKQGVGQLLFDNFKQYCQTQNVNRLDVPVNAQNTVAIAFYEKMGFAPRTIEMSQKL